MADLLGSKAQGLAKAQGVAKTQCVAKTQGVVKAQRVAEKEIRNKLNFIIYSN